MIASIKAPKIHDVILTHEREALASRDSEEPGQSLILLLRIEAWFTIYQLAHCNGVATALGKLEDYYATLYDMEANDVWKLEKAQNIVNVVVAALIHAEEQLIVLVTPSTTENNVRQDNQLDLCNGIKENPLLDVQWLAAEEQVELSQALENVNSSQSVSEEEVFTREPFVLVLPPRYIEWEVFAVDCCMWKIPNVNNLAPISIATWQAWATISSLELRLCREQALNVVTKSDKAPIFISSWPMWIFGYPKYHCRVAAGAKIIGQFVTSNIRLDDHKSKLWNWLRPFLRCSCYNGSSKSGCALELVAHPEERFMTKHGDFKGLKTIEPLFKPGAFSDKSEKQTSNVKQVINLNAAPKVALKRKGLYTNHTPSTGQGRGYGRGAAMREPFGRGNGSVQPVVLGAYQTPIGASNSHFAVNIGIVNNESATRAGTKTLESPLQRRNIQFQFM
ncbi:unnamed protein product [Calypogeia fissa]